MKKSFLTFTLIVILLASCAPARTSEPVAATTDSTPTSVPTAAPAYVSEPVTGPYNASDFVATEILGRPTATSITVNVVPAVAMDFYYEYGAASGTYTV